MKKVTLKYKFDTFSCALTSGAALLASFLTVKGALAAACCGSGSLAPQIVTGDYRSQIQIASGWVDTYADASTEGQVKARAKNAGSTHITGSLAGAYAVLDRWQVNAQVPVTLFNSLGSGLGDLTAGVSYEALPRWDDRSPWPEVFATLQVQAPTGTPLLTGGGFWKVSAGAFAIREWKDWDFDVIPELHYSLPRVTSDPSAGNLSVTPGWGGSLLLGAGYSPGAGALRFGAHLQGFLDQAREVILNGARQSTSPSAALELGVAVSWLVSPDWSLTLSFSDPGVFNLAQNTTLSRTVGLQVQKRWFR